VNSQAVQGHLSLASDKLLWDNWVLDTNNGYVFHKHPEIEDYEELFVTSDYVCDRCNKEVPNVIKFISIMESI